MSLTVESATSLFGEMARGKLANAGASGQPEDQLRSPFEAFLKNMAMLANLANGVEAVGESSITSLKTRPDYAVTVHNALIGFVELKAPGKGADPRKFKDPHDRDQWERLKSLPNLLYTDGNSFSLWQNGELTSPVLTLIGDVESAGKKLAPHLQALPRSSKAFSVGSRCHRVAPRSSPIRLHVFVVCSVIRSQNSLH